MKKNYLAMSIAIALFAPSIMAAQGTKPSDVAKQDKKSSNIEVIMVKGEKISRSLQDTTSSVSVYTQQDIEESTSVTLFDLFATTSNVSTANGDSGFTIRGISNQGISGTSDLASVYLDGAIIPSVSMTRSGLSIFDLEAVEILKGPQSTTQGRNALAGAIHLRTAPADYDFSGRSRISATANGDYQLAIAQNINLIDDTFAARIVVDKRYNKGFVENTTLDRDDWDQDKLTTVRAKLRYDASDDLQFRFSYTKADKFYGSEMLYARGDKADFNLFDRKTVQNDLVQTVQDEQIAVFNIEYQLNDQWSFDAVSTYSKIEYARINDPDNTELSGFTAGQYDSTEYSFSQEFKAHYNNDWLTSVFALYHSNIRSSSFNKRTRLIEYPFGDTIIPLLLKYQLTNSLSNKNLAFYTSNDIKFNELWSMNLGLRFDTETVTTFSQNNAKRINNLGAYNDYIDGLVRDATSPGQGEETYNVILPRVSATYQLTDDINLSAIYSTGYRSGGLSVNVARGEATPYDAEYNDTYELAIRSAWLDNSLIVNANAFVYKWNDQQVNITRSPRPFDNETRNAGASSLSGLELDVTYYIHDDWKLSAAIGYNDTEFDDFKSVDETTGTMIFDYTGNKFPNAAKYTASMTSSYRFSDNWFLYADASYRAEYFNRAENEYQVDSLASVNFKLGYETDMWDVYFYVKNLFDNEVALSEFDYNDFIPTQNQPILTKGSNHRILGGELTDPRTIGLEFNYRWD
ncbi:MAG: TonB-dependent receptor [Psychrobium sp.]|nr:TonB-dependent receptor [Psychrobium sp.]